MPPIDLNQIQSQVQQQAASYADQQGSTSSDQEGIDLTPSDYFPHKGESFEDWNKRAVLTYGSAVASATCAAAFPAAAPYCGAIGPIMVKALLMVSDGIVRIVQEVLPNSWTAQGVFDATAEAPTDFEVHEDPFNPSPLVGGPLKSWEDALATLDALWAQACIEAGLDPQRPMQIPLSALQAPDRIEDHQDLLKRAGEPHLPQAVRDRGYAQTSEEALLAWLDSYAYGWRYFDGVSYDSDDTEGTAYVYTSKAAGRVDRQDVWDFQPVPNAGYRSRGPFGLHVYGWPERCNSGCKTKFFNARNGCWRRRLFALAVALRPVAWAMVRSVENATHVMSGRMELQPGGAALAVQGNARGEGDGIKGGLMLVSTVSTLALAALAWRSWAHWHNGQPFWSTKWR